MYGLFNPWRYMAILVYLAASQLQSIDARKVFPCFDEPDFKAKFTVTIRHEPEYRALSNMPSKGSKTLPSGWIETRFEETPIMSTYLLAFVVSDFEYKEKIINGFRLRVWSQPQMVNQTSYALDFAAKTYKYFTDYFNIPELIPKADHVAVPDFSAGAMENWGLVIYRETALLYDPNISSSSNKYMITLIVAHEIAHTWFGNMVTMKWWTDLWLNEGFASTLMFFAMNDAYEDWNVFAIQVVEDIFHVMVKDALDTSHPVSTPINDPNEIIQYFDAISYNKGLAILRMLRGFLGWEDFRRGLQNYIKKYKFSNAEMHELWATFSETVNHRYDVAKIMDTWTRQMGYPVIKVTDTGKTFLLEQDRFLLNPDAVYHRNSSAFEYRWHVPFTYRMGDAPAKIQKLQWLRMGSATIPKTSNRWIMGNVDYLGFYRVNYEKEMWQKLIAQLNTNHHVFLESNRAGLIDDALILARAERVDYSLALNVTTFLSKEDKYVPWRAFVGAMEFIRGMLATTEAYGMLTTYLRNLVSPIFDKMGTDLSGPLPERYLRRVILDLACKVGVKNAIAFAKDSFRKWMLNGTRIPADYCLTVYSVGIREYGMAEWDFLWNKALETHVATERETMMEALAQAQQPWLLWRFVAWVFDSSKIRMQDVRLLFTYLAKNPSGRMVARFSVHWFSLREIIPNFTAYVNTYYEMKELEQLFEDNPPIGATKAASSSLALIKSNIRWKERCYPIVLNWLRAQVGSIL